MTMDAVPRRATTVTLEVVALLAASTLLAGFVAARYDGLWGETDSNVFATAIRAMLVDAHLVPASNVYVNGYGFPALGAFLVRATGLSVAHLQLFGGALLVVWLVIPAWLAYRELTGSGRGATLATVFILAQPEFLFPVLRGTHEKFTRGLMFLCLYLFVRSVAARLHWRRFAALLLAFYLAIYALVTFNNLLATSFIVAVGLALVGSLGVRWLGGTQSDESAAARRRMLYVIGVSLLLAFLFTFYTYPPARHGLLVVESMWNRLAMLFLEVQDVATNPYQAVETAWTSSSAYLLLSIPNWLLLGVSFVLWVVVTLVWWRNRSWPQVPGTLVLWSLYGAFGLLGALSVLVDISGAVAGNLQLRSFSTFAMVAAALVADRFVHWTPHRPWVLRWAYGALAVVVAFLSIVAVIKATNEPALSNKWIYYAPGELVALDWSRRSYQDATTWAGLDERLRAAIGICCAWEMEGARFDSSDLDVGTRNALISDIIRARSARLGVDLPIPGDSLRVYDNGDAEIYHLRPRTPFQR